MLDPKVPPGKAQSMPVPSPYWGEKLYWYDPAITNHAAMDSKGRVWMSSRFRLPENQPAFCATHPSAALAPQPQSFRQIQYFDPKTRDFKQVDICFDVHHVQFANDADETLYGNGPFSGAIGWVRTRVLDRDRRRRARRRAGAAPITTSIRTARSIRRWIGRFATAGIYSVIPHPTDGSVWGAVIGPMPGRIVRLDPKTCVGEAYEPPFDPASGIAAYSPRGIDVDSNGVIWTALAGSGHLASFDRRKCKVLSGPAAVEGQHCREGWTLHPVPGPRFKNVRGDIAADFQVLQLRRPLTTRSASAPTCRWRTARRPIRCSCCDRTERWLVLRVPYPLGFFSRGMDGRIDDPKAGWKGRGVYANYGPNAVWHVEGGLGTRGAVVKFQLRPDPLAK